MISPVGADPLPHSQAQQSAQLTAIVEGYIFDGQAEPGVLMDTTNPFYRWRRIHSRHAEPSRPHRGSHRNRKTNPQLMAEQISAAGVLVFAADIKGDLSGVAMPGQSDKLLARTAGMGQEWQPQAAPLSSSRSAARATECRCERR